MFTTKLLLAALLSTALGSPMQEEFEFATVEGNEITIQFDREEGTPLTDLIRFTQTVVDVPLDYNELDFEGVQLKTGGRKTIRRADFWHYFQTILTSRDYVIVPYGNVLAPGRPTSGPNTGFFAIRRSSGGVGGGARPGYIKSRAPVISPEELKHYRYDTGVVVTTSLMLQHVNCQEAANMLQTYFTDPMLESVRAISHSNSLVITGFAQTLYGIHELLKLIDVEPAQNSQELKRIVLKHALAEEIRPIVVNMLASQSNTGGPPQGGTRKLPPSGAQVPRPIVEADQRTNSLLIMATRKMHDRISILVEQLDMELPSAGQTIVLPLKHAAAKQLAGTLHDWVRTTHAQHVSVVPDAASNSLLITASKKQLPALLELVQKLDQRRVKAKTQAPENG